MNSNTNPSNLNVIAASNSSLAPFQARVTTNSNTQKENRSAKTNSFRSSNNENSQNNNGSISQLRSEVKI